MLPLEFVTELSVIIGSQTKNFIGKRSDLNDFVQVLKEGGVAGFNSWASKKDKYGLDLRGIHLSNLTLRGINLRKARLDYGKFLKVNFENAILSGISADHAIFKSVNFEYADLVDAFLQYGHIIGGSMANAILFGAHFKNTKLADLNLSYANLNGVDFMGATLKKVEITGSNTWGIEMDANTKQEKIKIVPFLHPFEDLLYPDINSNDNTLIESDDIEVAQLLFLLRTRSKTDKSEKVKNVIDALTGKIVLILGNFGRRRLPILKAIREKLSKLRYIPVIFDFEKPKDRDLVETVAVLAGLSRFAIADFTAARSTPLEALLIIPGLKISFAPIILGEEKIFSMFDSLGAKYDWVLEPWHYKNKEDVTSQLEDKVVIPCEKMRKKIVKK
jgi:hypothetical protein